jgi:hypothetical protein
VFIDISDLEADSNERIVAPALKNYFKTWFCVGRVLHMKERLIEALNSGRIGKEDLVVLALLAMLSEGKERRYFDRMKNGAKLSKLLFLVAYGEFDQRGKVVGLRPEPRIDMDFVVYLSGVATSTLHDSIERLKRVGLLEIPLNDRARYVIYTSLEDVMSVLKERDPELYTVLNAIHESYADMEGRELANLVNNLIGINSPETKAIFFGVSIRKLLHLTNVLRQLEQEGKVVDV